MRGGCSECTQWRSFTVRSSERSSDKIPFGGEIWPHTGRLGVYCADVIYRVQSELLRYGISGVSWRVSDPLVIGSRRVVLSPRSCGSRRVVLSPRSDGSRRIVLSPRS